MRQIGGRRCDTCRKLVGLRFDTSGRLEDAGGPFNGFSLALKDLCMCMFYMCVYVFISAYMCSLQDLHQF